MYGHSTRDHICRGRHVGSTTLDRNRRCDGRRTSYPVEAPALHPFVKTAPKKVVDHRGHVRVARADGVHHFDRQRIDVMSGTPRAKCRS
ncbi:hypothetical protein V1260_09510 [Brachybacterium sp. J144]|nr:hypothetical protein [Brachybacterium sp. J144]MEE1651026.1 hypothetical protein [Brachybacterium sp. J144]